MCASALGIALENNKTLGVYPFIPEMEASLSNSSSWISGFKGHQYNELKYKNCCCYYRESQHLKMEIYRYLDICKVGNIFINTETSL